MKRSLVNVLVLLFIFQGFWNVAASFCQHEIEVKNIAQTQHFGHHKTMSYEQASDPMAQQKNAQQLSESQTLSHLLLSSITAFDDHHDHLPSFAHYIIKDVILQSVPIQFKRRALDLAFFGGSLYQSPDLSAQTPPPDDSPLLVG